jgi:hypothetical protein
MKKPGLILLGICIGLVGGLLLGYTFFHKPGAKQTDTHTVSIDTSGTRQYFYRLNDTLAARHTVSSSASGVLHRVDTVAIEIQ